LNNRLKVGLIQKESVMRKCYWPAWPAILLMLLVSPARGEHQHAASSDISVRGEIVDLACYIGHGAKGADHQQCAAKCAEMGQPLGLLASDGKLYILVADHQDSAGFLKARKLAGEQVEMTGTPAEKNGIAALTVHDVRK
jgi:hypothetical protein